MTVIFRYPVPSTTVPVTRKSAKALELASLRKVKLPFTTDDPSSNESNQAVTSSPFLLLLSTYRVVTEAKVALLALNFPEPGSESTTLVPNWYSCEYAAREPEKPLYPDNPQNPLYPLNPEVPVPQNPE